jgi:hypothetical protein
MSPYVIVFVLALTVLFILLSLAPILISLLGSDSLDPSTQTGTKAAS